MAPLSSCTYPVLAFCDFYPAKVEIPSLKRPKKQLRRTNSHKILSSGYTTKVCTINSMSLPADLLREIIQQSRKDLFQGNLFGYFLQVSKTMHHLVKSFAKEWLESANFCPLSSGFKTEARWIDCISTIKPDTANFKHHPDINLENLKKLAEGYPELRRLCLRSSIIDAIPHGFSALEALDLADCDQITDESLRDLNATPHLKELILWNCNQITDDGLHHLQGLTNLEILDLGQCFLIEGRGLKYLQKMKSLKTLGFYNCDRLQDTWLECLRTLPSLESLDLRRCFNLTPKSLAIVVNFPCLRVVDLSGISEQFKGSEFGGKVLLANIQPEL